MITTYADYKPLTFHDAACRFTDGNDSARAGGEAFTALNAETRAR